MTCTAAARRGVRRHEACVASVCVADAGCADPTPDPVATYRIAINDFNFAGGQDYTIFGERSTETSSGILLIEAMEFTF